MLDFDISLEETGFALLKEGNFASFAPANKCRFHIKIMLHEDIL